MGIPQCVLYVLWMKLYVLICHLGCVICKMVFSFELPQGFTPPLASLLRLFGVQPAPITHGFWLGGFAYLP